MKFLIISDQYLPSTRSGSFLIDDLIQELLKKNHKITLITSGNENFSKKNNKKFKIIRINKLKSNYKNFILKGINELYFFSKIVIKLFSIKKNFDKIFIYSPPLFLGLLNLFFKNQRKILNIQDIFPQNAIDLKILKNFLLIYIMKKIENYNYKISDKILVNSLDAKKYLCKVYPEYKNKFIFNYNWSSFKRIRRIKYKKNRKFKFIFGGSIGPSQNLDKIIIPFKNLQNECCLDIYGNGILLNELKAKLKLKKIDNIKIFKPVSNDLFIKKIDQYDSGLITLSSRNSTPFIPGKFNFYCTNKKNITAIVHKNCDLNWIIKKNKLGFVTNAESVDKITKFLKMVIKQKNIKKLNLNAFNFAKKNLDVVKFVNKFEKM